MMLGWKMRQYNKKNLASTNLSSGIKHSLPRKIKGIIKQTLKSYKIIFLGITLIYLIGLIYLNKSDFITKKIYSFFDHFSYRMNFTLQNVFLEGQNHTKNSQIIDALNVRIGQSILSVPINDIKDNIENISWVKNAIIERKFPDSLFVKITERVPIAFWQSAGKIYLIDSEGSPILEKDIKQYKDLVILIGEDAPLNVSSLLSIISKNPELYKLVSSATRVGERRWNIKFHNGLEVKLPEENPEKSWNYITNLYEHKNLFANGVTTIDLRIPDRLYIK
jgi:cell division protein FtsQ